MAQVNRPTHALKTTAAAAVLAGLSLLAACDERSPSAADVIPVKIAGKTFYLEVAAEPDVRMKGLGGRTHIEEDGGMIFSFTPSQAGVQSFVMRDCPIPIDIIYLNGTGRVLTTYTMLPEPPRSEDGSEGRAGDMSNRAYEERLKRYSSRFPSPFVIELREGTISRLGVKEGDQVTFDIAGLKKRTK
ncbi:MAG: DUF192 domain-containing protein [Phycisphaerales bacterium]